MKRSVKFGLVISKTDCHPIRMRLSYGGIRLDLRLGYSIEPCKWDMAQSRVKPNTKNKYKQTAGEINTAITDSENWVHKIFSDYQLAKKHPPTPTELKEEYNVFTGKTKRLERTSFYDVYDLFVKIKGKQNSWEKSTYSKFTSIKNHLQDYNTKFSLENLTETQLQNFIIHQQNKGLRNTTISKNISFLKWFLRWSHQNNYYFGNLHETFKPKLKGTDGNSKEVIHLSWEELMHLNGFEFPENRNSLSQVRDVFCFCCFTGLRYSDVAKLRRSDIKDEHIKVVTQKTIDGLIIELNDFSRKILKKYEGENFPNNLVLPVISNAKTNKYLKEMGKLAGITDPQRIIYFKGNERIEEVLPKNELLTTHCGRRTFIVNALRLGIPSEVIMKWTGHNDHKSMKPYVKIVDELKSAEMKKFNVEKL